MRKTYADECLESYSTKWGTEINPTICELARRLKVAIAVGRHCAGRVGGEGEYQLNKQLDELEAIPGK